MVRNKYFLGPLLRTYFSFMRPCSSILLKLRLGFPHVSFSVLAIVEKYAPFLGRRQSVIDCLYLGYYVSGIICTIHLQPLKGQAILLTEVFIIGFL